MSTSEDKSSLEVAELQPCRVCNVPSTQSYSLYKPHIIAGELTTLGALLSYCANLQVLEEEQFLPTHICKRCVESLTQVYDFKRTALRTDHVLRKRNARLSRATISRSPSPANLVDVEAEPVSEPEAEANAAMEAASADEYVYVLEEPQSPVNSVASHQPDDDHEPAPDEMLESEVHFEVSDPTVEFFEVNYNLPVECENDSSLSIIHADIELKLRPQQRRKSHNPALQCPICGKQLSTSNSFKYHMQLHGDNRPFVCSICGESFKTRNAYDGHITLHNPNNPNKCTFCGKIYRQASSLRSHLFSHSGVKPFTCDICGKGLTQKSGYKKHMLTHTGEKPHTCDTCGRNFRYSSNLIAHKRSHTRKNPTNPKPAGNKKTKSQKATQT
ncbi:PREDICTED: zinc finger protein Gfi-1b [Drosophila arizonae]|uniref:Zinc finger protein Gfi-1b n=1 Tax=Drosophila arizonae TaxID=7263 RepID=A0ABM1PZK9_DROAR|nr:PREDICTED: zinc finger protein Gfi-1b [Drosophila arizonae]